VKFHQPRQCYLGLLNDTVPVVALQVRVNKNVCSGVNCTSSSTISQDKGISNVFIRRVAQRKSLVTLCPL
jgi:hypothetical protein